MKQADTDALTHIADDLDKALKSFKALIRDMDEVVDQSPVQSKGQPMTFGEQKGLAEVITGMRRVIEDDLKIDVLAIEEIIRMNMREGL